jgi:hypothetical protein
MLKYKSIHPESETYAREYSKTAQEQLSIEIKEVCSETIRQDVGGRTDRFSRGFERSKDLRVMDPESGKIRI